jgi:hypothetical protein
MVPLMQNPAALVYRIAMDRIELLQISRVVVGGKRSRVDGGRVLMFLRVKTNFVSGRVMDRASAAE